MRILLSVHLYVPTHAAGGETFCHNLATFLVKRGHQVRVLLHEAAQYNITEEYFYEGVEVFPFHRNGELSINWADVIITHLGYTSWTISVAKIFNKPVVFISHNTWVYDVILQNDWVKVIYNSHAMKGILNYPNDSIILHPSCDYRKYDLGKNPFKNKYITLINLNKNKGSRIFFNIAKAMPERKFLAVRGGYDPQIEEKIDNVEFIDNTPDVLSIYENTRVLLMPSKYESWGMCATEAMCNGIPVIYSPTFGLCENVGENGIKIDDPNPDYVDPDIQEFENPGIDPGNFTHWVKAIKTLDDPDTYEYYSLEARKRSRELDPTKELLETEKFLYATLIGERYIPG